MASTKIVVVGLLGLLLLASPAAAKVGDPVASFTSSPLMNQLLLTPRDPVALSGPLAGAVLYRYISDDDIITVDLVVRGGLIEQQVMYLPFDMQRGGQVSFFLQDAIGSVFGATQGLIAFRAAVNNRNETYLRFGGYLMRFTPIDPAHLRVLVTR